MLEVFMAAYLIAVLLIVAAATYFESVRYMSFTELKQAVKYLCQ